MPTAPRIRVLAVTGPDTLSPRDVAHLVDTLRQFVDQHDPEELRVLAAPGAATVVLLAAADAGIPRRVAFVAGPAEGLSAEVREALAAATSVVEHAPPAALPNADHYIVMAPDDGAAFAAPHTRLSSRP